MLGRVMLGFGVIGAAIGGLTLRRRWLPGARAAIARSSMPSATLYDLLGHRLFRGRYHAIAAEIAIAAPAGRTCRRSGCRGRHRTRPPRGRSAAW